VSLYHSSGAGSESGVYSLYVCFSNRADEPSAEVGPRRVLVEDDLFPSRDGTALLPPMVTPPFFLPIVTLPISCLHTTEKEVAAAGV